MPSLTEKIVPNADQNFFKLPEPCQQNRSCSDLWNCQSLEIRKENKLGFRAWFRIHATMAAVYDEKKTIDQFVFVDAERDPETEEIVVDWFHGDIAVPTVEIRSSRRRQARKFCFVLVELMQCVLCASWKGCGWKVHVLSRLPTLNKMATSCAFGKRAFQDKLEFVRCSWSERCSRPDSASSRNSYELWRELISNHDFDGRRGSSSQIGECTPETWVLHTSVASLIPLARSQLTTVWQHWILWLVLWCSGRYWNAGSAARCSSFKDS